MSHRDACAYPSYPSCILCSDQTWLGCSLGGEVRRLCFSPRRSFQKVLNVAGASFSSDAHLAVNGDIIDRNSIVAGLTPVIFTVKLMC